MALYTRILQQNACLLDRELSYGKPGIMYSKTFLKLKFFKLKIPFNW